MQKTILSIFFLIVAIVFFMPAGAGADEGDPCDPDYSVFPPQPCLQGLPYNPTTGFTLPGSGGVSGGSGGSCGTPPRSLFGLICIFTNLLNAVIPLIIGLALVGFLWGVAKFILAADDAAKREEGRTMMIYGIIALFVMISIWGLVAILGGTFGVPTGTIPQVRP